MAPKHSGVKDYIGMFVNTAGLGLDTLTAKYKEDQDDYSYIMAEALADRLAEAVAEWVHEEVRKELWGYSPAEALSCDDLLKVKYQVRLTTKGYDHKTPKVTCSRSGTWCGRGSMVEPADFLTAKGFDQKVKQLWVPDNLTTHMHDH